MAAQELLDNGRIEDLVACLRALRPEAGEVIQMVRTEAGYFEANAKRMRYIRECAPKPWEGVSLCSKKRLPGGF